MRNLRSSLCCSVASTLLTSICLTAICVTTICTATLSFAEAPDRIAGAIDSGKMVVLKSQIQRRALPQFDQGRVPASLQLSHVTLLTVPSSSQVEALKQLLDEQQDPKSANFHKWLTPEKYADRFGLSHNDIEKASAWLKSQGLTVVRVANTRSWIAFSGTASQIESAFRTEIHRYNVNGELHFANAAPPSIPAALSGIAVGFRGLDDFRPRPRIRKAARTIRPNYYYNDPDLAFPNFAAPGDIATLYDFPSGIDGTGEKLVIVGQTDVYLADLVNFRSGFTLPAIYSGCTATGGVLTSCTSSSTANFQYVLVTGSSDPGVSLDDLAEADLDLEWSAATAPGAQIIFDNSTNAFDSLYDAIDNSRAPVISMSYGTCEFDDNLILDTTTGDPLSDEMTLMTANSEGITVLNSSGDSGAAECDPPIDGSPDPDGLAIGGLAVSYPASSPEVTGVGGTSIPFANLEAGSPYWGTTNGTTGGSVKSYIPESAWNDDVELAAAFPSQGATQLDWQQSYAIVESGGGPSNCAKQTPDNLSCVSGFPQPSWQTVTIPDQTGVRLSPDVSLLASPNFPGYIYCTPVEELSNTAPYSTESTSSCGAGGTAGINAAISGVVSGESFVVQPSLVGGTSASAPIFAGIVTMLNQYLSATGGLGNINSKLYILAATPSNNVFHPVTTGTNIVYCEGGTPTAPSPDTWPPALVCPGTAGATSSFGWNASTVDTGGTGYNLVTGLGSVDVNALFTAWNASSATVTLSLGVNSLQVNPGQPGTATINVSPAGGTLTFVCTEPTALASSGSVCTVTPASPTNAASISVSISTVAPTAQLQRPLGSSQRIFFAALLPGLLGIVFTAGSRKRAARGLRFLSLIVVLGFSTLWLASCSSNSSSTNNPGTPAGTYPVVITTTTGGGSVTLNLEVQ
jgi:subtilase family serine protease